MSPGHAGRRALPWRAGLWFGLGLAAVLAARALDVPRLLVSALEAIRGLGAWGALLFVLLYVLACVLLLPGSILTLGAGAVYGLAHGTLLVSLSATLGATAAFLVGRHLARGWVSRRLAAYPRFGAVDRAVAREGWKIVGLTRLSPLFPFNLLNYALGLTRIPLRHYVLASWAGMLPGTVMYVYLGSVAGELAALGAGRPARTPAEWTLAAVGLVATVAVTAYVTRLARRALAQRVESPA
jgi:uncharacterized membrane protein YdjX (TVP38/TMEM64 family)